MFESSIFLSFALVKEVFSNTYDGDKVAIRKFIKNFDSSGQNFDERNRNSLKLFELESRTINIKSFKKPNLFNSIVYRFFRPSKAQRSFEYAHRLQKNGIGTPQPIAFFEERGALSIGRSFYVSVHLDYDLTYRELVRDSEYVGDEDILTAFGKFTYSLHAKGIHFLDHSVGNTLITLKDGEPRFYLVDLNRMKFGTIRFEVRMKNFDRLSKVEDHIRYMAKGYAQESGEDEEIIFRTIFKYIKAYQEKFYRKKRWKRRLKL